MTNKKNNTIENTQKYININKHKSSKKRMLSIGALIVLLFSSALIYAVNADIVSYFNQSRTNDGYSGSALERNSADFTTNGCGSGTMLDSITGLCWQRNMAAGGTRNWSSAGTYCSGLSLGGHSDWRLPTRNELFTLIDQIGSGGATCTTLGSFGFNNCNTSISETNYWSATTSEADSANAWRVGFYFGDDYVYDKWWGYETICVRRN